MYKQRKVSGTKTQCTESRYGTRRLPKSSGHRMAWLGRYAACGLLVASAASEAQGLPAVENDDSRIEEITVTAQRREQAASDVGVSITILNGDNLIDRGITSTADLAKIVPGFTAADSSLNVPVYSLRGVGINESTLAANATVAVAVGEVPLPYTAMTPGAVLDIQRVEVLKGPQGTLYGLNATGGAINYVPNMPGDSFEAGGQFSYGRFNTLTQEAYVSGPLSDSLRARIAISSAQGDAWQESYARSDSLGVTSKRSGRVLLNWINEARGLNIDFMASGWIDQSDTPAAQAVAFRPQSPGNVANVPQTFAEPLAPDSARAANWTPGLDYGRDDNFGQLALKAGVDLIRGVRLLSTTAYSYYSQDALVDRDGIATTDYHAHVDGTIKSTYQEIRLAGDAEALTWSAGANYRDDKIDDDQLTYTGESTIGKAAGLPIPLNVIDSLQKVKAYAFFADGEYHFTDPLSVVAGVRYTRDRRNFAGCSRDAGDGLSAAAFTVIANSFRPEDDPIDPILPGECATLADDTFEPGLVVGKLDEDNVAYKLGVNYRPADRSLLYASISRGYKAGSFPTIGTSFAIGEEPATQERVDAYEVGFKALLLDRSLQLNGAAYYYDYKDKQLRGRVIVPVLGSLSKLVNIPKSEIYGAELEAVWAPTTRLTFNGVVSYIETEIKEFTGVDLYNELVDFQGSDLNYVPTWSVNAGVDYHWPLSSTRNGYVGSDLTYRSRTSGFLGDDPDMDIDAYATVDVRIGIESSDERWRVGLFGNNVTDTYYWTSVNRGSDTIFRYAAKPATYGISAALRF